MSPVRVKTHIPASRQITIALPEDFPLGDVELEIVLRRPPLVLPRIEETPEEQAAFWASILAFRDEANRETKSGPYADDDEGEQPHYVECTRPVLSAQRE
jgi:hypothetical protein